MQELELFREIRNKEEKSVTEHILLKYRSTLNIISEILVDESKLHLSSEEAIRLIRETMNDNL